MKVKCITNDLNSIKDLSVLEKIKKRYKISKDFNIKIGQEYTVYGIVFWSNVPLVYICKYDEDEYPVPTYIEHFEITDEHFSKYWKLSYSGLTDDGSYANCELVFDEWAKDKIFYEKLIDGAANEKEIFRKYRLLMDKE